jgi:lysophospholipase L1-like esterase
MRFWKPRRLRSVMYAFSLLIAALFVAELALRLVGFQATPAYRFLLHSHARDVPLLIPVEDDPAVLMINPVAEAMFNPIRIAKVKATGAFRLVCLGGSSVRGVGLPGEERFPAQLQGKLRDAYPDRSIEVINLGGSGLTSTQMIWAAESAAELRPDLVIIYSGHNDWTGMRLYGGFTGNPGLLRLRAFLARGRLYVFARHWLLSMTGGGDELAKQPTGGPATHGELAAVARRFRHNIAGIEKRLRGAGAKVLVVSVISNPWFPPANFPWSKKLLEDENGRPRQGLGEEDVAAVLREFDKGEFASLDPAVSDYLGGLHAVQNGVLAAAYRLLENARDDDAVPLRATKHFRDFTMLDEVRVFDLEKQLRLRFLAGEPISDLFLDNLHPSRNGAEWIAAQLTPTIEEYIFP